MTTLEESARALEVGRDTVLLDNTDVAALRKAVAMTSCRALPEASGELTLDRAATIAATGVDLISVAALAHPSRAVAGSLNHDLAESSQSPAQCGLGRRRSLPKRHENSAYQRQT